MGQSGLGKFHNRRHNASECSDVVNFGRMDSNHYVILSEVDVRGNATKMLAMHKCKLRECGRPDWDWWSTGVGR